MYICSDHEWVPHTRHLIGVDKSVLAYIHNKSSYVAGIITLAATTCDITFEQGASAGAADTITGDNPQVGATPGIINMSEAAVSTVKKLIGQIHTDDWEAWPGDVPLDYAVEISAGNGCIITSLSDQDCKPLGGYALLLDTDLPTEEDFWCAASKCGAEAVPHATDAMVIHDIMYVGAKVTYSIGNEFIEFYEVDDLAGTKTLIAGPYEAGATTALREFGSKVSNNPIVQVSGKRFCVKLYNDTGAHTVTEIEIAYRSKVIGPAIRKYKTMSFLQD